MTRRNCVLFIFGLLLTNGLSVQLLDFKLLPVEIGGFGGGAGGGEGGGAGGAGGAGAGGGIGGGFGGGGVGIGGVGGGILGGIGAASAGIGLAFAGLSSSGGSSSGTGTSNVNTVGDPNSHDCSAYYNGRNIGGWCRKVCPTGQRAYDAGGLCGEYDCCFTP